MNNLRAAARFLKVESPLLQCPCMLDQAISETQNRRAVGAARGILFPPPVEPSMDQNETLKLQRAERSVLQEVNAFKRNRVAELQRAEQAAFQCMNDLKRAYSEQTAAAAIAAEDEWFQLHQLVTEALREHDAERIAGQTPMICAVDC